MEILWTSCELIDLIFSFDQKGKHYIVFTPVDVDL